MQLQRRCTKQECQLALLANFLAGKAFRVQKTYNCEILIQYGNSKNLEFVKHLSNVEVVLKRCKITKWIT